MKKLLSVILVICSLLGGNAYAEIFNLKCMVVESKIGNGDLCNNCVEDDGLSIDIKNKKILVSPYVEDITHRFLEDKMITNFSNKYIQWIIPLYQLEFKFNRHTYELEFTNYETNSRNMDLYSGEVINPNTFFFKATYNCEKINKI